MSTEDTAKPLSFLQLYIRDNPPDLTLSIQEELIHVHKLVLTLHSPVFKSMLDGNFKIDDTIELDHHLTSFKYFIDILYDRFIKDTVDDFGKVPIINLLDYYGVEHKIELMATQSTIYFCYKNLTDYNARQHNLNKIYKFLTHDAHTINKFLETIVHEKDMISFMATMEALNNTTSEHFDHDYFVSDSNFLKIISMWIKIHKPNTDTIQKLLSLVRLDLLNVRDITDDIVLLESYFDKLKIYEALIKKLQNEKHRNLLKLFT